MKAAENEPLLMCLFLQRLAEQGMKVSVEDGELRLSGSKDILTPTMIETLRKHKKEFLKMLNTPALTPAVQPVTALPSGDPRPERFDDSELWQQLLALAYEYDGNKVDGCYGALHGLRCCGAELLFTDIGGAIGCGEMGAEEYRRARNKYLLPLRQEVEALLGAVERPKILDSPVVRAAIDEFGCSIVRVIQQ